MCDREASDNCPTDEGSPADGGGPPGGGGGPPATSSIDDIPDWSISTYELELDKSRKLPQVHINHPNRLGQTEALCGEHERARLKRMMSPYISKEMHDAATARTKSPLAWFFRRIVKGAMRDAILQKACFRREDIELPIPPPRGPVDRIEDHVPYFLERSRIAVRAAHTLYGPELMRDMELGFTPVFSLDDPSAYSELPTVESLLLTSPSAPHDGLFDDEDTVSLVVSYRHTTPKAGRILNIVPSTWSAVLATVANICRAADMRKFRLWTDQLLSSRTPTAALRWVSSGILPYTVYPVVYATRGTEVSEFAEVDLRRMWISVEHLAAAFGQGIVHTGDCLEEDVLPPEWPTTYITLDGEGRQDTWLIGHGMQIQAVVRKLACAVMCGLVRNKALSWASDAQDMIDWACTVSCGALYMDIAHSFDCEDCKLPLGYTSGFRMMALLGSGTTIVPGNEDVLYNQSHPRVSVPAVELVFHGRQWDGFREWVPESCLWGLNSDMMASTRGTLVRWTSVIGLSYGGDRAVAVLQFSMPTNQEGVWVVAHLLVGLVGVQRSVRTGTVTWSKRFWPVYPLSMFRAFAKLWDDPRDRDALIEMGEIVGASSCIDSTDLVESTDVMCLPMRKVRWS